MQVAGFVRSVKGKIIISSILACFALLMAWETSKNAFKTVLNSVDNISAPNEKLRLVNELSYRVTRLEQAQKASLVKSPAKYYQVFDETKILGLKIDTLKSLYTSQPKPTKLLNTLKKLLQDRDKLFTSYLNVRWGLINNKSFSAQVRLLNQMVNNSARQTDSLVTTTEKRTATTTIFPANEASETEQHRGFFSKIFGKKAKNQSAKPGTSYLVIDSELKVKQDTIRLGIRDSLLSGLGKTVQNMEKSRQQSSERFVRRETMLNKANAHIIYQILTILKKVEQEALTQNVVNNQIAKAAVNNSIKRLSIIMFLFLIVTVGLAYFILRDISRINKYRKEADLAKEKAEYSEKAKHRFLSNMSHEIRTPLQSIIGYAGLARQQAHPQKADIEAIYQSSGHLLQIVNEILDYNRIISGKFTFKNEIFNLEALLNEVVSILRLEAEKKSIIIKTKYDSQLAGFFSGDPFRLKQVLFNLLGNAIKFTAKGQVTLTVHGELVNGAMRCFFNIEDTGPGLSATEIERIFNEFEQADNETQSETGTGLGLAITRQLVERQGGKISVKSEPGKGSSFIFELLFEMAVPPEALLKPDPILPGDVQSLKVWIADDDSFIRDLCVRIFAQNKIPCRSFASGDEMVNTSWDHEVTCLLVDMRMPGLSGIEVCRLMRERVPQETMIYALTAQVMPEERGDVLKQGFNGLLTKPFKEMDLIALVKQRASINYRDDTDLGPGIKAVEKMTMGDNEQTSNILLHFADDSLNDLEEIQKGLEESNLEILLLVTHRIAGRTAQAGYRELAESFRLAEMDLRRKGELTDIRINNLLSIAKRLDTLAKKIRGYALKDAVL